MKKPLILIVMAFVLLFIGLAPYLKPVPILPEKELTVVTGRVEQIREGSSYDVIFILENAEQRFYINRGLERGLTINGLRQKLEGRTVVIKYPEHKSLFGGNTHHLSKLELGAEVIFSELEDQPVH